jgi:pantetheine-phosphate adenylyltransferase
MKTIAIYPGTFDPLTKGHLSIIERISRQFDEVYVLIANNYHKTPTFDLTKRLAWIKNSVKTLQNVKVDYTDGLTIDYASSKKANIIIRGLRDLKDFESEKQMALVNSLIDEKIESLFIISHSQHSAISSSLVKELASLHKSIAEFVPADVNEDLIKHYK